jgi:hypothetical protein
LNVVTISDTDDNMGIPIREERHTSPIPADSVIIPSVPGDLTVENQDEISSDRVGSPELEEGEILELQYPLKSGTLPFQDASISGNSDTGNA